MDPLGENPSWTLLVAALPAMLCTILIFMDQQITAVIINRKEHKLKVILISVVSKGILRKQQGVSGGTVVLYEEGRSGRAVCEGGAARR